MIKTISLSLISVFKCRRDRITSATMFSILFSLLGIVCLTRAQEPCSPMDPGEWTPVKPVLYPQIFEANEEDLLSSHDDQMYQSELRIHGVIDQNSPNGIIVQPQSDFLILNPAETFKFESISGRNIIRLIKPLDRDGPTDSVDDDLDVITFTIKCSPINNRSIEIFFDVSVRIVDKNDNPPIFTDQPYDVTINELTPVGTHVLTVKAMDKDANLDGNITYSIVKNGAMLNDGADLFEIDQLQGIIKVKGNLDYEQLSDSHRYYIVTVLAEDGGPIPRLSAQTKVKIQVKDGNDNNPSFIYPGCNKHKMVCVWPQYTTDINAVNLNKELALHGVPDVTGNVLKLEAMDMDAEPSDLMFSVVSTYPSGYESYFSIETVKSGGKFQGVVKQVKAMDYQSSYEVFVKAEENSLEKRFDVAKIVFTTEKSNDNNKAPSTTPQPMKTDSLIGQEGKSETKEEFSQTTVALIVVTAITLTVVVCLAIAMLCMAKRRSNSSDKIPLTREREYHENKAFSAQL